MPPRGRTALSYPLAVSRLNIVTLAVSLGLRGEFSGETCLFASSVGGVGRVELEKSSASLTALFKKEVVLRTT